jgi:AcrR family transcriptional regulator
MDAASDEPGSADDRLAEGLRERKKRLTRQLLSDTATAMFLERGFDGFKIAEVADECGVSEKTVYNYFPTKESLILDREEDMANAIRHALADPGENPVDAIVGVLVDQRRQMREGMAEIGGDDAGLAMFRRFMAAVEATPSLKAAMGETSERLARLAAECLAERAAVSPEDPEPTIAGHALIGLWAVQQRALLRDDPADRRAADVYDRAEAEVRRAAELINTGMWSFSVTASGGSREQLRLAAEASQAAGRQVAAALRQARKAWAEMKAHHDAPPQHGPWDWGDWPGMPAEPASREARQQWREMQREHVQRWREAQREQAELWRRAAQSFKQEQKDSARQLKEELKAAHRAHQDELRRDRH